MIWSLNKFVLLSGTSRHPGQKGENKLIVLIIKKEALHHHLRREKILPGTNYKRNFSHGNRCRNDTMHTTNEIIGCYKTMISSLCSFKNEVNLSFT